VVLKKARIEDFHFHDLRHTFATLDWFRQESRDVGIEAEVA
jgi:integrase